MSLLIVDLLGRCLAGSDSLPHAPVTARLRRCDAGPCSTVNRALSGAPNLMIHVLLPPPPLLCAHVVSMHCVGSSGAAAATVRSHRLSYREWQAANLVRPLPAV